MHYHSEPYDPCPCGSGKKYKFCCMAEDKRKPSEMLILPMGAIDPDNVPKSWIDEDSDEDEEVDENEVEPANGDTQEDRFNKIIGQRSDARKAFLRYLKAKLTLPCMVTGIEDFRWEEPYVIGGWSPAQYAKLKKTQPSYRDRFELLGIYESGGSPWIKCHDEDLVAQVKRVSDSKIFVLGLAELKAVDKKSPNYQLLDDWAFYFWNNR